MPTDVLGVCPGLMYAFPNCVQAQPTHVIALFPKQTYQGPGCVPAHFPPGVAIPKLLASWATWHICGLTVLDKQEASGQSAAVLTRHSTVVQAHLCN